MSHFDLTEEDEGTGFDSPIEDKDGAIALDSVLDSVNFRFWFDGDESSARIRTAIILQEDPAVVRYVGQITDVNSDGVLWGQWELDIVSIGKKLRTFPIRYYVAPLIGP